MHALSTNELLEAWERGAGLSAAERASLLLGAAYTDLTQQQIAQLSIGKRDRYLLLLREQTFGSRLDGTATCPCCAVHLEFRVNTADICSPQRKESEGTLEATHADYFVQFRLPNSFDLASIDSAADPGTNRQHLLQRCVVEARRGSVGIAPAELPAAVATTVTQCMAVADPQADVQLALACPDCQHTWEMQFDIISYFWDEIDAWANRLLLEVHSLASSYGWREADVFALSPGRRQAYLELIES